MKQAHCMLPRGGRVANMVMGANVRFHLAHGHEVVEQVRHAPTIWLAFMREVRTA